MGHDDKESARIVSQLLDEKVDELAETVAAWPSGRTLQIQMETRNSGDRLLVRNPVGNLELCLEFGPAGPRLIVPGGELNVESTNLSFNADCMNFKARSDVNWEVDGEFNVLSNSTRLSSSADVSINGRFVKLNCDENAPESLQNSDSIIPDLET
jgi:hypothetical protein